jgi:hypothetical protein
MDQKMDYSQSKASVIKPVPELNDFQFALTLSISLSIVILILSCGCWGPVRVWKKLDRWSKGD